MLVGIDFGKNIGIAYAVSGIAIPFCTVTSIQELAEKLKQKGASKLIIGWPIGLNGNEGQQCEVVKQMLDQLLEILPLPYDLQDERFSSRFSNATDFSRKKYSTKQVQEKDEHAHSAAWILQVFLDKHAMF